MESPGRTKFSKTRFCFAPCPVGLGGSERPIILKKTFARGIFTTRKHYFGKWRCRNRPNMGLKKARQALRWLENSTSKNKNTNMDKIWNLVIFQKVCFGFCMFLLSVFHEFWFFRENNIHKYEHHRDVVISICFVFLFKIL